MLKVQLQCYSKGIKKSSCNFSDAEICIGIRHIGVDFFEKSSIVLIMGSND
jgi:hypothetical protein